MRLNIFMRIQYGRIHHISIFISALCSKHLQKVSTSATYEKILCRCISQYYFFLTIVKISQLQHLVRRKSWFWSGQQKAKFFLHKSAFIFEIWSLKICQLWITANQWFGLTVFTEWIRIAGKKTKHIITDVLILQPFVVSLLKKKKNSQAIKTETCDILLSNSIKCFQQNARLWPEVHNGGKRKSLLLRSFKMYTLSWSDRNRNSSFFSLSSAMLMMKLSDTHPTWEFVNRHAWESMHCLLEKGADATALQVAVEADDLPNYHKLSPDDEGCIATSLMLTFPPAGIKQPRLDLSHF